MQGGGKVSEYLLETVARQDVSVQLLSLILKVNLSLAVLPELGEARDSLLASQSGLLLNTNLLLSSDSERQLSMRQLLGVPQLLKAIVQRDDVPLPLQVSNYESRARPRQGAGASRVLRTWGSLNFAPRGGHISDRLDVVGCSAAHPTLEKT